MDIYTCFGQSVKANFVEQAKMITLEIKFLIR